jgi:hypothetical protein
MSREAIVSRERHLLFAGVIGAAAALLLVLFDPRGALTGWLAAAVLVQALPMGATVYLLIMRLASGQWEADLRAPARLMLSLMPLGALVLVPPVAGMAAVYPWFVDPPDVGFARLWLGPPFFALRSLAWFLLAWYAARRAREDIGEGLASGLLIAMVLGATFVVTDWLMTLDPHFASSGFGLQVFALELCAALAALILLRLAAGEPKYPGVLGGLLLTLLLLWAYFQFMPFLIVWSGNLPDGVAWYMERADPGWKVALALAALLGGVPLLALLASQVRSSPRAVGICAASTLAGKAIEFGWLALPGRGLLAIVAALLALGGLGCLVGALLLRAARLAEAGL